MIWIKNKAAFITDFMSSYLSDYISLLQRKEGWGGGGG